MNRFITGEARSQATLFPERIDDYIDEETPVRVVDVFVDSIDLPVLGVKTIPAARCV
jgi:transposase